MLNRWFSTKNTTIIKNITGGFITKGASMVLQFAILPRYIKYFADRPTLGIWLTLISSLNWVLFLDIGIGNGLRNELTKAIVERDNGKGKSLISSAYAGSLLVAIPFALVGIVLIPKINWAEIFSMPSQSLRQVVLAVLILFFGTLIQMILKVINAVFAAQQMTALPGVLAFISSLGLYLYLFFPVTGDTASRLVDISLVYVVITNLPLFLATLYVFTGLNREIAPTFQSVNLRGAMSMFRLGGMLFAVQIAFMFITSSNEIIITMIFGSGFVVEYQVYYRVYYIILISYSLFTNTIWSAVSMASAQKNWTWIKETEKKLAVLAILSAAICAFLVPLFPYISRLWLGSEAPDLSFSYPLMFALWVGISGFVLSQSTISNGISKVKMQFILYLVAAALKIPVIFILKKLIENWSVVVLANAVVLLPVLVVHPKYLKRRLAELEEM